MGTPLKSVLSFAIILAAAVPLSGCALFIPTRTEAEDVIGTWVYEEDDHTSTITISEDLTFLVENGPVEFFEIGYVMDNPAWDGRIDWSNAMTFRGDVEFDRPAIAEFTFLIDGPNDTVGGRRAVYTRLTDTVSLPGREAGQGESLTYQRAE